MWTTQISILLSVLHASAASSPLCEAQTSGCSVDDTNLLQKSDPGRNSVNKPLTEDTNALSLSQQHQTGEQSARALDDMNKRYENMLREVVAGGPKELPTDSMLDPIINQFTVFKAELVGQQAHHQSLVEAALGDVNACNTNKATAFDESGTGVTDLETAMSSARTSHSLCRASETTAGADAAASCKLFEDQQASTCQAAAAWVPSNLASVGLLATDCVAKQAALTQSSSTCDTDQAQFELDFCAWSSRLKIVCSNLQACRGEALAERTLIVGEVEELESSHKRMHVAYEKALCFLNLLKTAKSANLTSTHIDSCTDLSPDTSALTVTYPNAPSAVTCSTVAVTHQPGDAEWRTAEYVNLAAAQLEPTVACPAAPTPAAPAIPTGTIEAGSDGKWIRTVHASNDGSFVIVSAPDTTPFMSTNAGANWSAVTVPGDDGTSWGTGRFRDIDGSADGSKLVAIDGPNIFLSSNFGESWTKSSQTAPRFYHVAVSSDAMKIYITGDGGNVYWSHDGGVTFTAKQVDTSTAGNGKICTSDDGSVIALASWYWGGGVFVSTDSGATFNNVDSSGVDVPDDELNDIACSGDGSSLMVAPTKNSGAASKGCIFTSHDTGATWSGPHCLEGSAIEHKARPYEDNYDIRHIAFCSGSSQNAVAAPYGAAVFKRNAGDSKGVDGRGPYTSSDGGQTWTVVPNPPDLNTDEVHTSQIKCVGDKIWMGTQKGIWFGSRV